MEETLQIKLTLTKSQVDLLERARQVLAAVGQVPTDAEILVKALDDFLTKRDPLRKAERAAALRGPRGEKPVSIYPRTGSSRSLAS